MHHNGTYSMCQSVRIDFLHFWWGVTIEVWILLGACGFVVDICDNLAIFVFDEDV